ncbi:methyltransferase domain-containing protein [Nonomuraea sp. NPDC049504]|uniref:SAM-dependent methyltransferase n=1 Tax=Nonomuraea sp. NPDC049504 TaxID=3154729 RepID=UPI003434B24B
MLADDADPATAAEMLVHPQFPRSAAYDPVWQGRYAMGPNPLWLAESLAELLDLRPGMRVLDLGCGRATSSIFLAKEFGVDVVAADLWVRPEENWARIIDSGVQARVMPIHAEAHDLKFAHEYFDVVISLDAYQYFGTDDLYLAYLQQFLVPEGVLGIVVMGLTEELNGVVPEHLADGWKWDFHAFHSPRWWREHLSRAGLMTVEHADLLPDGWRHWRRWHELGARAAEPRWRDFCAAWVRRFTLDEGRTLGLPRVVARKIKKDTS